MEFINLKRQYKRLKPVIDKSIQEIMADARFIGGKEVNEFEERLAGYVGRKHCISCGNGTNAILLAALVNGIGQGDAVFCPDMTFIASIEPACMLGAEPVFVDIDERTYNISANLLEEKIRQVEAEGRLEPKAVIMVDFLGNPAEAEAISRICRQHGLVLIEDAAQSMGAEYHGKKCGKLGDISCTSFFPSKPLGCYGDGGAVFTDNDEVSQLLRSYKVHGKGSSKYDNVRIGTNSRLDTIQAAVLMAKMDILEEEMEVRQEIASRYEKAFKDDFQIPFVAKGTRCSYAQYVLLAHSEEQRANIMNAMERANIPSLLYYPKEMHRMEAFQISLPDESEKEYKNAARYARCNFGLPFSPYLTEEEQELVIRTIKSAL